MAIDCGREYNMDSEECFSCKKKKECVEKYAEKISKEDPNCRFFIKNVVLSCDMNSCSQRQKLACKTIKNRNDFKDLGEIACENFGTPYLETLTNCINCNEKIFLECEIMDLLLRNPELTFQSAQRIIENQIKELRNEFNGCFGRFAFETICWKSCEYNIRCMRESGIVPGEKCKNFNKNGNFGQVCADCEMLDFCKEVWGEAQIQIRKEAEAKKLFMNFFSLKELRDTFLSE